MSLSPGPWQYQKNADAYTHIIRDVDGRFICQLSQDANKEDALLIATAPDLLKVSRAAWHALKSYEMGNTSEYLARDVAAAIASAFDKAEVKL
jgi:hypothetical protein